MGSRGAQASVVVLVLVALTVTGCSDGGVVSKAGSPQPVTLRMANSASSLQLEPAVAAFVDQAERRSGGLLHIEVTPTVGDFRPDAEQRIVERVASGEFDLAWVGTRVFDTLGVQSFAALTAPLLVDSYPLEAAVLASDLPSRMLPALDRLGVRGLALLAGGLRRPIAVQRPLRSPTDWRGITFAAFRSDSQSATVRALGAVPIDVFANDLDHGLANGTIQGFEKNLLTYSINVMEVAAPHVTLDVTLWPETAVLLGNPGALDRLTTTQRSWLRGAAAQAAAESVDLVDVDQGLLADLCAHGARFATTAPGDPAALREAVAPVYADLDRDPATASFIADIEEFKRSLPPAAPPSIPPGCADAT